MKIAVTGARGFIGRALCNELSKEHNVIALARRPEKGAGIFEKRVDVIKWNAERMDGWERSLVGTDAIVNLAGSNFASGRWSEKFKGEIVNSRVNSARTLLEAVKETEAGISSRPGPVNPVFCINPQENRFGKEKS
ncbi:MAG: NAD-dependent epimerase/dehydratase family protein [Planctomycetota bacterium]|jgi:NAD dependent epimerase/dehydratase family enzyme